VKRRSNAYIALRWILRSPERLASRLRRMWLQLRYDIVIHPTARVSRHARFFAGGGGRIRIGERCEIGVGAILNCYTGSIVLGHDCSVNELSILYGHGGLVIGNGVRIAAHVTIVPSNHRMARDRPIRGQGNNNLGIVIEDDVWIGAGARILDGVTIATGSVIGGGAVVSRSTKPYSINAGVPARSIGERQ
jgi:acetyltransferase-like isoleucine patch superfamily enzyme